MGVDVSSGKNPSSLVSKLAEKRLIQVRPSKSYSAMAVS